MYITTLLNLHDVHLPPLSPHYWISSFFLGSLSFNERYLTWPMAMPPLITVAKMPPSCSPLMQGLESAPHGWVPTAQRRRTLTILWNESLRNWCDTVIVKRLVVVKRHAGRWRLEEVANWCVKEKDLLSLLVCFELPGKIQTALPSVIYADYLSLLLFCTNL